MRCSNIRLLMAPAIMLAMCGCHGYRYWPAAYPAYDACDGYYDYGACEYDLYGECVDDGYYDYAGGLRRPRLRDRLLARREARMERRDLRRYRHGRHRGRPGIGADCCCGCCIDCCGWMGMDPCCGCGPCFDGCFSMSPCCGDCGPMMGCSSGFTGGGCYDGMMMDPSAAAWSTGEPVWEDAGSQTYVPYSHEMVPSEATPPLRDPTPGESYPVPPRNQQIPEGEFRGREDDGTSVIRPREAPAPLRQTRWVPAQF